jgi:hypothetical protein
MDHVFKPSYNQDILQILATMHNLKAQQMNNTAALHQQYFQPCKTLFLIQFSTTISSHFPCIFILQEPIR